MCITLTNMQLIGMIAQITSHLKLHIWNQQFEESQRRDQEEIKTMFIELLKSSELTMAHVDDMNKNITMKQDEIMTVMQNLQFVCIYFIPWDCVTKL